jgi:hypothetical protein
MKMQIAILSLHTEKAISGIAVPLTRHCHTAYRQIEIAEI